MSQDSNQWQTQIEACESLKEWDDIRVKLLGKSGLITLMLKELGGLSPENKKIKGAQINALKENTLALLNTKKTALKTANL